MALAAVATFPSSSSSSTIDERIKAYLSLHSTYGIITHSEAMQPVLRAIERAGPTSAPVLITGESGTGKELVARAMHYYSPRYAGRRFIVVNCAAIPDELVENELFGHHRGSYTGATGFQPGKFQLADGGTLFLDEIGDLSLRSQAKVLRAIETGEIEPLGNRGITNVKVRIIAATNRDLETAVAEGKFREDLHYRINVIPIYMPPLSERRSDIRFLADYFLLELSTQAQNEGIRRGGYITPDGYQYLEMMQWRGNVRKLRNFMWRAVVSSDGNTEMNARYFERLPKDSLKYGAARAYYNEMLNRIISGGISFRDADDEFKKNISEIAIERSMGVVSRAATSLRIHPHRLYEMIGRRYWRNKPVDEIKPLDLNVSVENNSPSETAGRDLKIMSNPVFATGTITEILSYLTIQGVDATHLNNTLTQIVFERDKSFGGNRQEVAQSLGIDIEQLEDMMRNTLVGV